MTFFIITFVLMMNFLWRYIDELTGKGLGADVIIELLFYATINLIPLGMPLAMLLAAASFSAALLLSASFRKEFN